MACKSLIPAALRHLLNLVALACALIVTPVMAQTTPSAPAPAPATPALTGIAAVNGPCTTIVKDPNSDFRHCNPADLIARSIKSNGAPAGYPAYGAYDTTVNGAVVHKGGIDPMMDWSDADTPMCFPMVGLAYANSLVYQPGGDHYPDTKKPVGSQGNAENFSYPWRDNFCESRPSNRKNPVCNVGYGHQGQDIRPQKPLKVTYAAIAAEDSNVISVPGSDGKGFTVTLQGKSPPYRKYRYLHLESVKVSPQKPFIKAGTEIGRVSDYFGWRWDPQYQKVGKTFVRDAKGNKVPLMETVAGKSVQVKKKVFDRTLIHLHFEIYLGQAETIDGVVYKAGTYVSPYMALAKSYQRRLALAPGQADTACLTQ